MTPRIEAELELLRAVFPDLEVRGPEPWIRVPEFKVPDGFGWNRPTVDVVIVIPKGYAVTPPKDIRVPAGLRCNGEKPDAYAEPASAGPFEGTWGAFSWGNPEQWDPGPDPKAGSNLLNFIYSFARRLQEGK